MEHKHKLLATASSQAQGACPESTQDRFSNLPDEVAHQILSFLNFRELIQVASVSKRCREFYLSRPVLDFSSVNAISKQHNLQLLNYFDRFLFLRGDNKIQHFNIHWNFSSGLSDEIFRLLTWIHIAVRCNVEVLKFNLSSWHMPETLELPFCIFVCQYLRSLFLDIETIHTVLKAPYFSCFTNLQDLMLRKVRIDEGFCKWISSSCKCIKKLQLCNVNIENFTHESSSLESFSFVVEFFSDVCHLNISGEKLLDIHIHWAFEKHSSSSRSLDIFAPNLKYFKWIGNMLNHQHLGKLMCLKKAQILLKLKADDYDFDFDKAYDILCSISRVKVLMLTEDTTKALCGEGSMPAPFNDISSLSMHIGCLNDDLVPAMVSLLRGMPNSPHLIPCHISRNG